MPEKEKAVSPQQLSDDFDALSVSVLRIKRERDQAVRMLQSELRALDRWLQDQSISDKTLGQMLVREDVIQQLLKALEE